MINMGKIANELDNAEYQPKGAYSLPEVNTATPPWGGRLAINKQKMYLFI